MMQIVYFSDKDQLLNEFRQTEGAKIFVTPSPAKADSLRQILKNDTVDDVITIAKFSSFLMESLWTGGERLEVKRKADLLLIFGILKEKYLPDLGFEQFTQAYNLFSDLRSFSLNLQALSPILEEQPEIIKSAVLMFWKLLELTGFHDEHSAYREITEKLRTHDSVEALDKIYVFWGFQHLNGQQIDLLKALSIRYQVIIPFPLDLREKIKLSDWPSWLRDLRTEEKVLQKLPRLPKANWLPVNSREIALNLQTILQPHDQIVIGVSKLGPPHLDLVPNQDVYFKIAVDILDHELTEVSAALEKFQGNHEELRRYCSSEMKSPRSMKYFRAWQLYEEALQSVSLLTDISLVVDHFLLRVLDQVVRLNQPRTSYVPVSSDRMTMKLLDFSSLEQLDRSKRVLLCIDERFDEVVALGQNYPESIQKSLLTLGPIKRNELELLFRNWEFKDLLGQAEVLILMNEGSQKHSLFWKRLLEDVKIHKINNNIRIHERYVCDYLQSFPKSNFSANLSASKLQSYIECPRNFYFSYVEKIFPDIKLEKDFDPLISGTIIHEVIELFFKNKIQLHDLRQLTTEVMRKWIGRLELSLPSDVFLQRELTFTHRAQNGILFIQELERRSGEIIEWTFEESFELNRHLSLKGRMDCLGKGAKHLFLIDFKSSEYSASSGSEIMKFDAVQLWIYAIAAAQKLGDLSHFNVTLGYVVLDDPSKSVIVSWDENLSENLKTHKMCKLTKVKEDFSTMLSHAHNRLLSLSSAIVEEKVFPPRPRTKDSCTYCELNKLCPKSELADV
jgi:CRISPR/Cas system-associated exonuclease Cas4 (RecB family)